MSNSKINNKCNYVFLERWEDFNIFETCHWEVFMRNLYDENKYKYCPYCGIEIDYN